MVLIHQSNPIDVRTFDNARLRKEFLSRELMQENAIKLFYTFYDRYVFGGIVPVKKSIKLPTYDALKSDYFLERREIGILNIGGEGIVSVNGDSYTLEYLDMLYVGRGNEHLTFGSVDPENPAMYYVNSCPAHHIYPVTKATRDKANKVTIGDEAHASARTIYQYIHEDGVRSCQLVMGYTELHEGNIWNTYPPHTHLRRMEVYFYFEVPEDEVVLHLMGEPQETKHFFMKNHDAVISPPWSIHAGAGSTAYKFVWGMAGENQAFSDMDLLHLHELS